MFNRPKTQDASGTQPGRSARIVPTDYQTRIGRCNVQIFGLKGVRTPDGMTRILDEDHLHAYIIDPIRQIVQYARTENLEPVRDITVRIGDSPTPPAPPLFESRTGQPRSVGVGGFMELPGGRSAISRGENDEASGAESGQRTDDFVSVIEPRWSLRDVYLPPPTRRSIELALKLVEHHKRLFESWGLQQTIRKGRGAILNFYGPPGTGKSITAEAIAKELGRPLLIVNYAELESKFVGETPKNIQRAFQIASARGAVLVFDEADSFLGKRLTQITQAADYSVNVSRSTMFMEIERYDGVLIFTTNLLQNYDPAFARRILASVEFEAPDATGREAIWRSHVPDQMPLAKDVDFGALARKFAGSGADIKDAVLMAAVIALDERADRVHMRHFEEAARRTTARYAGTRDSEPPK